jgi:hypothetical protein
LESSWQWKTHSAFHLQTLIPWTSRLSTHVWLPKGESRLSIGEINAPHWPDMSAVLATNFYLAKPIYWLKSKYARLYESLHGFVWKYDTPEQKSVSES